MEIKSARFICSNIDYRKCPSDEKPEYAFIGRSNVGKSSLINMITGSKGIAKTSSKPGKTMLINHFLINENWFIVDLPGYGYAKRSLAEREKLHDMITDYIINRKQLVCLFVLIDSRHNPYEIDLDFIQFLGEEEIPFALVFTKTDKLSKSKFEILLENYKKTLQQSWEELPPIFTTSSENKNGRDELLDYIESINNSICR